MIRSLPAGSQVGHHTGRMASCGNCQRAKLLHQGRYAFALQKSISFIKSNQNLDGKPVDRLFKALITGLYRFLALPSQFQIEMLMCLVFHTITCGVCSEEGC